MPELDIEPNAKWHSKSDSISLASVVVTLIAYALFPNFYARATIILISCSGVAYLAFTSHWVREWSAGKRGLVAGLLIVPLVLVGIFQLAPEWRRQNASANVAAVTQPAQGSVAPQTGSTDARVPPIASKPNLPPQSQTPPTSSQTGSASSFRRDYIPTQEEKSVMDGVHKEFHREFPKEKNAQIEKEWINAELWRRGYTNVRIWGFEPPKQPVGIKVQGYTDVHIHNVRSYMPRPESGSETPVGFSYEGDGGDISGIETHNGKAEFKGNKNSIKNVKVTLPSTAPAQPVNMAPDGILITGGTVNNPTINNVATPSPERRVEK